MFIAKTRQIKPISLHVFLCDSAAMVAGLLSCPLNPWQNSKPLWSCNFDAWWVKGSQRMMLGCLRSIRKLVISQLTSLPPDWCKNCTMTKLPNNETAPNDKTTLNDALPFAIKSTFQQTISSNFHIRFWLTLGRVWGEIFERHCQYLCKLLISVEGFRSINLHTTSGGSSKTMCRHLCRVCRDSRHTI